ncbi:MAG TPA: hypothetical protein VK856_11845, partial [Anaerolineaceae bacterium]|nr:hypothetical protein [Anaerolineaceae bacterium]
MWDSVKVLAKNIFWGLVLILIISNSGVPSQKFREIVRVETRWIEFDYVSWTIETFWRKAAQISLGSHRYMDEDQQKQVVEEYFGLINHQREVREKINSIYSDPTIPNPQDIALPFLEEQRQIQEDLMHIAYLFEAIIQNQVSYSTSVTQLGVLKQPVPPVQFHTTSMPYALIVSPRDVIRQDADVSLLPNLTLDQIDALEKQVQEKLDVSALVVQIGGVGVYPTMVMETSYLTWLTEVVAHEWIHNFLTLRPLGMLYNQTAELRTINETTASIAGKELGSLVIEFFYPIFRPRPVVENDIDNKVMGIVEDQPPIFDFRAEMRETRVTVDAMLEEGSIEEAELYMEQRRQLFVENGYQIRRLNQAYFAFHGAYADQPGGAAGEDPVGEAVRNFRAQSSNLAEFVRRIAWVTSFEGLIQLFESSQ